MAIDTLPILGQLVRERITAARISERTAAKEIGVSPSTMGRIVRGEVGDLDTLLKVCSWLGVSPASMLNSFEPSNLADTIAVIIEASPQLAGIFADLVERVRAGEVPPAVLRDVASYAAYKLQLEGITGGQGDRRNLAGDRSGT